MGSVRGSGATDPSLPKTSPPTLGPPQEWQTAHGVAGDRRDGDRVHWRGDRASHHPWFESRGGKAACPGTDQGGAGSSRSDLSPHRCSGTRRGGARPTRAGHQDRQLSKRSPVLRPQPVSYTHLTLPTKRIV